MTAEKQLIGSNFAFFGESCLVRVHSEKTHEETPFFTRSK